MHSKPRHRQRCIHISFFIHIRYVSLLNINSQHFSFQLSSLLSKIDRHQSSVRRCQSTVNVSWCQFRLFSHNLTYLKTNKKKKTRHQEQLHWQSPKNITTSLSITMHIWCKDCSQKYECTDTHATLSLLRGSLLSSSSSFRLGLATMITATTTQRPVNMAHCASLMYPKDIYEILTGFTNHKSAANFTSGSSTISTRHTNLQSRPCNVQLRYE